MGDTNDEIHDEERHIRDAERSVEHQRSLIKQRTAAGLPIVEQEKWLAVFSAGLAKHTERRKG